MAKNRVYGYTTNYFTILPVEYISNFPYHNNDMIPSCKISLVIRILSPQSIARWKNTDIWVCYWVLSSLLKMATNSSVKYFKYLNIYPQCGLSEYMKILGICIYSSFAPGYCFYPEKKLPESSMDKKQTSPQKNTDHHIKKIDVHLQELHITNETEHSTVRGRGLFLWRRPGWIQV